MENLEKLFNCAMQINWLPQNICDSIDQTTRNFIWKGTNNKGIHLVSWKKITKPKHLGGLGIRTARDANTCLLGKLVWDMVQSTNKLWVNLLADKYKTGKKFLQATFNSGSSPSWSSIIKAKDIFSSGYNWRAGSGSSSFWFDNWSTHGLIGSIVPVIDIHDIHLSVKDVFTFSGHHTQALYTILPQIIADSVNSTHMNFNEMVEDVFIWSHNKNGVYTTKTGYSWLLQNSDSLPNTTPTISWSWIWKLKAPEKLKLLVWLASHNAVPTLSLLHHRNIAHSAVCARCGEQEETILHCLRDCRFSSGIWLNLGFTDQTFFSESDAHSWIKRNVVGNHPSTFLSGLWWTWQHRNLMCLSHETWTLPRLSFLIHDTAESMDGSFQRTTKTQQNRMVRWNNENFSCHVLNVDGSCLGVPIRAGFGGVIRNPAGFYLSGFSGFISISTDILFAELTAIYRGFLLATEMGLQELVCYTDSLLSISLITGHASNFHVYAVLIQDIKDLLSSTNFTIHHCLREGNQCADYMAKLGANSNDDLAYHATPPSDLLPLIRSDSMGTFFPRA